MKWSGRYAGYGWPSFRRDLASGLIVGIIAIPLGMAFAIAAGVKPQFGLYTVAIAGFLVSLFGGSRFQIGGPTGAFVPVLLGIVTQYGYDKLLVAGLMAGVLLVLMGLLGWGRLVRYMPRPVTVGFTAGIAVIIFAGQIGNFLGLRDLPRHESLVLSMKEIAVRLDEVNGYSMAIAGLALAVMLLCAKLLPKVPGSLAGLATSAGIAAWLFPGKLPTIGSVYGEIPQQLPSFALPAVSLDTAGLLLVPAVVIALLGAVESLLSAVVADEMGGDKHNARRELIGQGIANIAAPLFGGIPATGAIARTAANIRNGAVSPVSGMIHAIAVLGVLLALAPVASSIPLASLAPILMVVAWNMSERHTFASIARTRTGDSLVLVVTFLLTVFANLTMAVGAGLLLAAIVFAKRMASQQSASKVLPDPADRDRKVASARVREGRDCPQIAIYTLTGPLFFGSADPFGRSEQGLPGPGTRTLVLRMANVPLIDATGEAALVRIVEYMEAMGGTVFVTGLKPSLRQYLRATGLEDRLGADHFYERTGEAIKAALGRLDRGRCLGCPQAAFLECAALSRGEAEPAPEREASAAGGTLPG